MAKWRSQKPPVLFPPTQVFKLSPLHSTETEQEEENPPIATETSFDIKKIVRRLLWLLPVSVAVSIAFVLIFTDSSDLLKVRSFAPGFFLLAALFRLVPWFTKTLRLLNWMKFLDHKFSYWEGFRISMMSELGAAISPTALGGEPVKTAMLYERGVSFGESVSLTTIASVEDLTFYLVGLPPAILISGIWKAPRLRTFLKRSILDSQHFLLVTGLVVLGILVVLFILWKVGVFSSWRKKLRKFWRDFKPLYHSMVKRGKLRFALNIFLAGLQWSARYSVVTALVLSLGYSVEPVRFSIMQLVVFSLMTVVPTPGASGGAEGMFLILFGTLLPHRIIGTVLIGWRFIDYYFLSILALIVLGIDKIRAKISGKRPPIQTKEGNQFHGS